MPISGGYLGGSTLPIQYNGQSYLSSNMSNPIDAQAYMANAISAPGSRSIVGGVSGAPYAGGTQLQPQQNGTFSTPYMANGLPQTGLIGSEMALQSGFNAAGQSIEQGLNQATQTLSPYTRGGSGAFDYQAALSGAMGPEAQAQAYANYQQSPGQQYLVGQGERAITRNAAATGGLQGGNVLQELQRHGIGIAAQDFNDSFNRLGQLSGMGLNAAQSLGGMQYGAGGRIGDYAYGTGQAMSGGRTRAGEQIADAVGSTTSAMANLANQQGTNLSGIIGGSGQDVMQLLTILGINDAQSLQQLALTLGNINIGQASTVAGLPGVGQFSNTWDAQTDLGNVSSAISNILTEYNKNK